jgi:hypothetical protein
MALGELEKTGDEAFVVCFNLNIPEFTCKGCVKPRKNLQPE